MNNGFSAKFRVIRVVRVAINTTTGKIRSIQRYARHPRCH
jgi:hypothetical protein